MSEEEKKRYSEFEQEMGVALEQLGIDAEAGKIEQLYRFYLDLIEKNRQVNLTAITEMSEVIRKHFADSLSIIKIFPDIASAPYRIMDLGTGAGFPGVPLAIVWPQLSLTLADSLNKRILFIEEEKEKLSIKNIRTIHARAEDVARDPDHREQYDVIVSRAVANLSTLLEYCLPFIHKNGKFIPYKSGKVDEECAAAAKAMKILGAVEEKRIYFTLPESDEERCLLLIRKEKTTPKKYPRKAGIPSRAPIS